MSHPNADHPADPLSARVEHAKHEVADVVQQARDAAGNTYQSAREYALETTHALSDRAQQAGQQTARYMRRASLASERFTSVHALPLTVVSAGLGWLAISILRESWRARELEQSHASRARMAAPLDRRPFAQAHPRTTGPTTTGEKLMGVHVRELASERDSPAAP